jgi:rhodanese-related sulfurtransferase
LAINIKRLIPGLEIHSLCYCNANNRSALFADMLRSMGYQNAKVFAGELKAYQTLG